MKFEHAVDGPSSPIYADQSATYHADTCAPLTAAVAQGQLQLKACVRGGYPGRQIKGEVLDGVRSVGYWDARRPQAWGLDWHRNEGLEITYLERGRLAFAVRDQAKELEPGDVTITRPWQPHRVGDPHVTAGRLHWLILDVGVRRPHQPWQWPDWLVLQGDDLARLTQALRQNERPVWSGGDELRRCFADIADAVELPTPYSRLAVAINQLLVLLLEMFDTHPVTLDASLSTAQRTVELFLAELAADPRQLARQWTVTEMAERCGLGPTRFTHLVRQVTNMTPARFLCHLRVELAGRMLRERPELSVTQVAFGCGFASSQYFATVFKRATGASPSSYGEALSPSSHALNDRL